MNLTYKPSARRVVPNWRYYEATLAAGELNNWKLARPRVDSYSIEGYAELWEAHHSLYRAGDLLSAAVSNGCEDKGVVKDAASFILEKESIATNSLIEVARRVLGESLSTPHLSKIEIDRLKSCTAKEDIRGTIHTIRQRLHSMPYNPFLYVDLSRAYLLMGQTDKAKEAIERALFYGATDRFVARSAARLFIHMRDLDRAHEVIRAQGAVAVDPWLMATEVSISMLRERTSNYVKTGLALIDSGNCSPFGFTELASSLGTLELSAGANRKSNKLFRKALIAPNDNSLAQVQWARSYDPISFDVDSHVANAFEVRTYDAIHKGDYNLARHEAVSWICDMPYAHKPINIGYSICLTGLQDFNLASAILDIGLRLDDTDPFLLNNKAYCSARAGQVNEAREIINKLVASSRLDDSPRWRVCVPATEGIVLYRGNQIKEGAKKYEEAIRIAKQIADENGDSELYRKALLNYCRERLRAGDGDADMVFSEAKAISIKNDELELKQLFEEVHNEYNHKRK